MPIRQLSRSYLIHAAAFAPAIAFLLWGRFGSGDAGARWSAAYLAGGLLALPHAAWLLKRRAGSWIALGVDLYLAIGGLLALASAQAVDLWGRGYGAAPALASVFAIGLAATLLSPLGFIGEPHPDPEQVRRMSAWLLLASGLAAGVALWLRANPLLGGVAPVLAVLLIRGRLAQQLALAR